MAASLKSKKHPPSAAAAGPATIPVDELREALSAVALAVPTRCSNPALLCVLIADGSITATDLELRIEAPLPSLPTGFPAVLLPAGRLSQILEAAPRRSSVTIEILPGGSTARLTAGQGHWSLSTHSPADFPPWTERPSRSVLCAPTDQFYRGLRTILPAAGRKPGAGGVAGVLIEMAAGVATLVATDGRRLCAVEIETGQAVDDSTALVPRRSAEIVERIAAKAGDSTTSVEASANDCAFTVGSTIVRSVLLADSFPKWRTLLSLEERLPSRAIVTTADFLNATNAAAICTDGETKGCTFHLSRDHVEAASKSSIGSAAAKCKVIEAVERPAKVMLDPAFVSDYLETIDASAAVEILMQDSDTAVLLKCDDATCVIMPMAPDQR